MIRATLTREGRPTEVHSGYLNEDEKRTLCLTTVFSRKVNEGDVAILLESLRNASALQGIIRRDVMPMQDVVWTYALTIKRGRWKPNIKTRTCTHLDSSPAIEPPKQPARTRKTRRS
jgi:hypothetical protein